MASRALASNNPARESRAIYDAEEFVRLAKALPLPDRLSRSFERWVLGCTEPSGGPKGVTIYMYRPVHLAARAAGVCETTMRAHIRQFEKLGLVQHEADTWLRTKKHVVNLDRLRNQNWPEGRCPRCRHKHLGKDGAECGCEMGSRVWRRDGHRERQVQRTCHCAVREIAPPRHRKGPQGVPKTSPSSAPPEASPPVQPAARPQPSPAAPARENTLVDLVLDGSRKAERVRKLRADFGIRVAELIAGRQRYTGREGLVELQPNHPEYRLPMARDEAIRQACDEFGIDEAQGRQLRQVKNSEEGP